MHYFLNTHSFFLKSLNLKTNWNIHTQVYINLIMFSSKKGFQMTLEQTTLTTHALVGCIPGTKTATKKFFSMFLLMLCNLTITSDAFWPKLSQNWAFAKMSSRGSQLDPWKSNMIQCVYGYYKYQYCYFENIFLILQYKTKKISTSVKHVSKFLLSNTIRS